MVSFAEALKVMVWQGIKSLGYNGVMFISERTPQLPFERKKITESRGLGVRDIRHSANGARATKALPQ